MALLLFLLKANAALLLFVAVYYASLRRLTFYALNRVFLLFALLFAAIAPPLTLGSLFQPSAELGGSLLAAVPTWAEMTQPLPQSSSLNWLVLLLTAYWLGVSILGLRLLGQALALYQLHRASAPGTVGGVPVRWLSATAVSPFSFGRRIYLNPDQYQPAELTAILAHEQVHVRQWHTLDVVVSQLLTILCWFNPGVWLLRRAVLENLEYLTDYTVLHAGHCDAKTYQYSLLRLSRFAPSPTLTSQFAFLTLKNRIAMMNTPPSPALAKVRYLLALPLAATLLLGFTTAQASLPAEVTQAPAFEANDVLYYIDGELATKDAADQLNPKNIASTQVFNGAMAQQLFGAGAGNVAVITTKKNANLSTVRSLNQRIAQATAAIQSQGEKPAPVSALPPAALAHITQNYSGYRLVSVAQISDATTKQVRYKAQIAKGRRPIDVLFDAQGQALASK